MAVISLAHCCAVVRQNPRWPEPLCNQRIPKLGNKNPKLRPIHTVDSAGGIPKEVVLAPGVKATEPSYSHDGAWIYFASDSTGRSEVWRVSTVTGAAAQVTKNGGALPAESPDGRFLFYLKTEGVDAGAPVQPSALYRQPSGGGPEERVLKSSIGAPAVCLSCW